MDMQNYDEIKLIVLDVDGTLTDGGIYYASDGSEIKRFDVKDGLGIKMGLAAGLEFAIITGRESPMVQRRAKELGIRYLRQNVQKKGPAMRELLQETGLSKEQVAYMGDDLNDKAAMELAGVCACPSDADADIRKICHYIAPHQGGKGAVRDFIQELLTGRRLWNRLIEESY
jgi:3-deoxy-D-manno-octulosonate 8-phosphate phosphatase (KDO 8-P phosphatase)